MGVAVTIICHAATRAVREAAFPLDEPLDEAGRAKAAAMAAGIRRVDAAWTSPSRRAVETAAALRLDATIDGALRDLDCGAWSGRRLEDVAAADPAGMAAWLSDAAAAPHGGESVADLLARVAAWLDGVGATSGRVVAVTHAATARAALVAALGASAAAFWRIDIAPLARLRLRGQAGRWTLLSLGP